MQTKPIAASLAVSTGGLSQEIEAAFPFIDSNIIPLGSRILVQLRQPKVTAGTKGLIHIPDSAQDAEKWNTQVAVVRAVGPLAFHNRNTGLPWPEGAWAAIGDFVRVPKYGGDRIDVLVPGTSNRTVFALFNDLELLAKVTGDPRDILAYV